MLPSITRGVSFEIQGSVNTECARGWKCRLEAKNMDLFLSPGILDPPWWGHLDFPHHNLGSSCNLLRGRLGEPEFPDGNISSLSRTHNNKRQIRGRERGKERWGESPPLRSLIPLPPAFLGRDGLAAVHGELAGVALVQAADPIHVAPANGQMQPHCYSLFLIAKRNKKNTLTFAHNRSQSDSITTAAI